MIEEKREKLAAVVVTFNRKQLLGECLGALLNQTFPLDAIYVIDNASTDGTSEFLVEKSFINKQLLPTGVPIEEIKKIALHKISNKTVEIHYVRMPENTGGAGGFYEGVKRGYEGGFNWLWLMDDDGYPEENTLEKFSSINVNQDFCYCPLVVDPKSINHLTFGFYGFWDKKKIYFEHMDEVNGFIKSNGETIIAGYGNFYNGIFLSRKIVRKAGFPNNKMYIWGDENEYLFRILSNGFNINIMLDNVFYHPRFSLTTFTFLGKQISYIDNPATWKFYFKTRNYLYITKKYKDQLGVRWPYLKCVLHDFILAVHVKKIRNFILLGLFDHFLRLPYKSLDQLKK